MGFVFQWSDTPTPLVKTAVLYVAAQLGFLFEHIIMLPMSERTVCALDVLSVIGFCGASGFLAQYISMLDQGIAISSYRFPYSKRFVLSEEVNTLDSPFS